MPVKAFCSGIALCMTLTSSAYAAQSAPAEQWLQRLQSADAVQGYQGTFVYERKGAFSTHQIWRQVNAQGQLLERFLQLNGPAHEVVRIDKRVTCVSPTLAGELPVVDIWPVSLVKPQDLQQWYDVHELGESRVAGHIARVLLFSPRDQHRYAVELHIDQATAIPLKTLLLNDQGQLLERLEFVQFQASPSQTLTTAEHVIVTPSAECLPITDANQLDADEVSVDWAVDWTPPGFVLLKSFYKQPSGTTSGVLSQVYSDGLASFSVFFENIDNLDVEGGRRQLGPTAVVSRKIEQGAKTVMVTVIGEIPLGSAERIALSMQAEQEHADD